MTARSRTYLKGISETGDTADQTLFTDLIDSAVNVSDDAISNEAASLNVRADKKRFPTTKVTQSGALTFTSVSSGAINGYGEVKVVTCDGSNIILSGDFTNYSTIETTAGQTIVITFVWNSSLSEYMVSVDPAGTVSGSTYTFANTQHMLIDAVSEGMRIDSNALLPSDGSGTDSAMTWEFWYETPGTITGRVLARLEDSGEVQAQIGYSSAGHLYITLFDGTDAANTKIGIADGTVSGVDSPVAISTLYHIVVTYSGNEAEGGLNIYVDGTLLSPMQSGSAGSYVGLTGDKSGVQLFIPRSDAAQGEGEYQVFRVYNAELSGGEVTTLKGLYDTNDGLNASLQAKCIQENLFEGDLNADNIGTNGTTIGTPTFVAN